ncbi:sodium- and chloride-dependent glycine transporter 1-like isoform X6 [Dermacentor albipictus]|uniref:sodium- and chloride-dependent glycine transporter 1-like isoform X6 n=1 Tax=Dermacentor albipictus TaxID=60249 RepID=UPI0038FCB5B3
MISTSHVAVSAGKAGDEDEAENEDEGRSSSEEKLPGESRATWGNQCELFLSCLGMSMGLGSFWRMPSLVRANGGAAFLVSYVVVSLTVAKPVFFMELFLGQFSSQGSVGVWRCAPIGKGIGICMCYVSLLISMYFVCFAAHAMLFVWKSLGDRRLPWATCDEKWGADAACFVRQRGKRAHAQVPCKDVTWWLAERYANANLTEGHEVTYEDLVFYVPDDVYKNKSDGCQYGSSTAAEQFYFRHILGLSESVSVSGNFRIDILVCIGICWIVFYLTASRGIRLSRKIVYVTSLVSYALLSVLLLRGLVRLPGADFGIHYMLKPEWSKLLNIRVWYEAMRHSLLSGGVSTGVIINVGSFNHFSSGTYTVVAGVALAEVLLGLVSGAVVFSVLGSQSERLDMPIEDLARHGLSLFFLSFTEAVADIDFAYVWSAGFFGAFVLCALDSNSLMVESVLTPLGDEFTCARARRPRTAFAYSLIAFFASMPLAMQNGVYLAILLDTYVRGMLVPIIAFVEICVIVIFYVHDAVLAVRQAAGPVLRELQVPGGRQDDRLVRRRLWAAADTPLRVRRAVRRPIRFRRSLPTETDMGPRQPGTVPGVPGVSEKARRHRIAVRVVSTDLRHQEGKPLQHHDHRVEVDRRRRSEASVQSRRRSHRAARGRGGARRRRPARLTRLPQGHHPSHVGGDGPHSQRAEANGGAAQPAQVLRRRDLGRHGSGIEAEDSAVRAAGHRRASGEGSHHHQRAHRGARERGKDEGLAVRAASEQHPRPARAGLQRRPAATQPQGHAPRVPRGLRARDGEAGGGAGQEGRQGLPPEVHHRRAHAQRRRAARRRFFQDVRQRGSRLRISASRRTTAPLR